MKLQYLKLFIMTEKNPFLEDFREISLVDSLKIYCEIKISDTKRLSEMEFCISSIFKLYNTH